MDLEHLKFYFIMNLFQFAAAFALLCLICRAGEADYTHQDSWGGTCNGTGQSPINIVNASTTQCSTTKFTMSFWDGLTYVSPIDTDTEASSLFSEFPSSVLTIVDADGDVLEYTSIQYHIHSGAEHRVEGVQAALELHLVHKLSPYFDDPRNYAVVGLLFYLDESLATNLFDVVDFTIAERKNFKTILSPLITGQGVYHYRGSLTTPTCGEIVNWYVVNQQYPIRQAQLDKLVEKLNNGEPSARDVQPLNNRTVWYVTPECATNMPNIKYNILSNNTTIGAARLFALIVVLLASLIVL